MGSQRYIYLGDRLTDERLRFQLCTAVTAANGKCIRSRMGTMLVDFGFLGKVIVIARRLRKIKKFETCPDCPHPKGYPCAFCQLLTDPNGDALTPPVMEFIVDRVI